jgi:hypothetical protein
MKGRGLKGKPRFPLKTLPFITNCPIKVIKNERKGLKGKPWFPLIKYL